jgi:hypothetical protein
VLVRRVLEVRKDLEVRKLFVLLVLLTMMRPIGTAQAPAPARDGAIAGQVVDPSGRPVSAVVVTLSGAGVSSAPRAGLSSQPAQPRILTGADGRFVFGNLPAGRFSVVATKSGYAEGSYGRRRPGGAPQQVTLSDTQRSADISIRIWKNAAIGGAVIDEAGEPVVGVQVRVLNSTLTGGRKRFTSFGGATTDDRGVYRFSNLPPGEYKVVTSPPPVSVRATPVAAVATTTRGRGENELTFAMAGGRGLEVGDALMAIGPGLAIPPPPVDGRVQIYPPTFPPSTLNPAQSPAIVVASGEERNGVDIQLQPVPTARVSGTVIAPAGPVAASLRLVPSLADEIDSAGLAPTGGADAGGNFVFPAVVPGEYRLKSSTREGAEMHWLDLPISVNGNVDGVTAVMRPALSIAARFEFEGAAPRPERTQVQLVVETVDGTAAAFPAATNVVATPSGITVRGYGAGRYLVRPSASPAGWMFKSAMFNGVDVSETPLDLSRDVADVVITFTDRWTGIGGAVQGQGADGAMVVVFPTDAQAWTGYGSNSRRLKSARADAQGRFGISSLPPGDYFAVAIPEEQSVDWRDGKNLEALSRIATRVAIGDGEHRTIDLRLHEVRQ